MSEGSDTTTYRVVCHKCGPVAFEDVDGRFHNETRATWYAGYHSGKAHPDSDKQEAFPETVEQ